MNKNLIITVGDYGSGKSSFAKWYARETGGERLDFDFLEYASDMTLCIKLVASTVNKSKAETIALDGWGYNSVAELARMVPDRDISLCFCFCSIDVIKERQRHKRNINELLPQDSRLIIEIYNTYYRMVANSPYKHLYVDTSKGFEFLDETTVLKRIADYIFLDNLHQSKHDKYYQDIELPSGVRFNGTSNSHESWERLVNAIDFKGKTVLDVGSFHGYFSFKAEEAGAEKVIGVDACKPAVDVARDIATLKYSRCVFTEMQAEDLTFDEVFDIVFCMNMIHFTNIPVTLEKLFTVGKMIIFEIKEIHENLIIESALDHGFNDIIRFTSHRPNRLFIICSNHNGVKVETCEFKYNYQREHIKHNAFRLVERILSAIKLKQPVLKLLKYVQKRKLVRGSTIEYITRY